MPIFVGVIHVNYQLVNDNRPVAGSFWPMPELVNDIYDVNLKQQ